MQSYLSCQDKQLNLEVAQIEPFSDVHYKNNMTSQARQSNLSTTSSLSSITASTQGGKKRSLLDRLGGYRVLQLATDRFYQYLLMDDRVNIFFIHKVTDIARIHYTLIQFLCGLFGGPQIYRGPDLVKIHKNMPITTEHFLIVWEHFEAGFKDYKVKPEVIAQIKAIIVSLKDNVVQNEQ